MLWAETSNALSAFPVPQPPIVNTSFTVNVSAQSKERQSLSWLWNWNVADNRQYATTDCGAERKEGNELGLQLREERKVGISVGEESRQDSQKSTELIRLNCVVCVCQSLFCRNLDKVSDARSFWHGVKN